MEPHIRPKDPLDTSAAPIREASESKHWRTTGYLGASLASSATSMFALPVSCLRWRSRSLYLSFRIPYYLLTWSQPKTPLVSVSVCRGGVLTEKQEDCQVKSTFLLKMRLRSHQDTLRPEDRQPEIPPVSRWTAAKMVEIRCGLLQLVQPEKELDKSRWVRTDLNLGTER